MSTTFFLKNKKMLSSLVGAVPIQLTLIDRGGLWNNLCALSVDGYLIVTPTKTHCLVTSGSCDHIHLSFDDIPACLFWSETPSNEERIMTSEFIFSINVCNIGKNSQPFWSSTSSLVKWGNDTHLERWCWGMEAMWKKHLYFLYAWHIGSNLLMGWWWSWLITAVCTARRIKCFVLQ